MWNVEEEEVRRYELEVIGERDEALNLKHEIRNEEGQKVFQSPAARCFGESVRNGEWAVRGKRKKVFQSPAARCFGESVRNGE